MSVHALLFDSDEIVYGSMHSHYLLLMIGHNFDTYLAMETSILLEILKHMKMDYPVVVVVMYGQIHFYSTPE